MALIHAAGLTLAVGGSLLGGYAVAGILLGERRSALMGGLAVGFAVTGQAFFLAWLPAWIPAGWSAAIAGAVMGVAGAAAVAWRRLKTPGRPSDSPFGGGGPAFWILLLAGMVLVYISALAFWIEATAGRADVAALYLHSGLVSSIARGNFPVVNMFEPEYAMSYRFTFHILGAAFEQLTGAHTGDLMPPYVAGLSVALFLTSVGVIGRLAGGRGPGLAGATLVWAAGPLYWTGIFGLAAKEGWPSALSQVVRHPDSISWSGVILGPTFTMPTHNPTNVFGLIPAMLALMVLQEIVSNRRSRAEIAGLGGLLTAVLTVLAASSEYFYAAVLAGGFVLVLNRAIGRAGMRPAVAGLLAATAIASAALSLTTSSVLANLVRGDRDVLRLGLTLNTGSPGTFSSWGYNAGGPFYEWPFRGQHEAPVFSEEFVIDGGLALFIALPVFATVLFRPRSTAAGPVLASLAGFTAATVFHFRQSPPDIYRFAFFGEVMAVAATAIWIAPALRSARAWLRIPARVVAAAAVAALTGGFALSAIAWPGMIAKGAAKLDAAEAPAIEFLKTTDVRDRLLVLWGSRTASDLYDPATPQVTAFISAETGQFIPYGYHHLSRAAHYSALYGWAQEKLEKQYLTQLQIKYVYSNPGALTDAQRAAIAKMLADGSLAVVLETGIETRQPRILYRYVPQLDARDEGRGT